MVGDQTLWQTKNVLDLADADLLFGQKGEYLEASLVGQCAQEWRQVIHGRRLHRSCESPGRKRWRTHAG